MSVVLLLVGAGFAAGFVNAVAGGGTLLSFPALLAGGLPAIMANATNTLALWPGSLAGAWAYRRRLRDNYRLIWIYGVPSLVGGMAGAVLLLATSERLFRAIVPYLILLACGLLALHEPIGRWLSERARLHPRRHAAILWVCQLLIGVYGGYFGAGIGILMLAAMAVFLPEDLQTANALKTLLAALINAAATVYFVASGTIHYPSAALVGAAAVVGGYVGARLAQRLPARWLRALVIACGVGIAGYLLAS